MSAVFLAVEKNDKTCARESNFWLSRDVSPIRVSSMCEGIEKAVNNKFLFIVINAENIDYQPQLPLLRETTNDPIFVFTAVYTTWEQGMALSLGADLFVQLSDDPNDNFDSTMACINRLNERAKRRKSPVNLIFYGNILLAPLHRQVFINDMEVELTKIDFDMLHYFMNNRGFVLSAEQIYSHVWGNERAEYVDEAVRSAIKRLRKKICGQEADTAFIETVREVGYRLPAKFGR